MCLMQWSAQWISQLLSTIEPCIGTAANSLSGAAASAGEPEAVISMNQSAATIEPGIGTAANSLSGEAASAGMP